MLHIVTYVNGRVTYREAAYALPD